MDTLINQVRCQVPNATDEQIIEALKTNDNDITNSILHLLVPSSHEQPSSQKAPSKWDEIRDICSDMETSMHTAVSYFKDKKST